MNKKYLAVLAVSAVLALASCGGGNQPANTSKPAETSTPAGTSTPAETSTPAGTSTPAETSTPAGTSSAAAESSTPAAESTEAGITSEEEKVYVRGDDNDIYDAVLGEYEDLIEAAHAIVDDDERYVAYAKAEGELLAQGLMVPTYTQGGTYAITRVAPKTVSAALHGLDSDRLQHLVAVSGNDKTSFIKAAERNEMKALWETARAAGNSALYDPAAYLTGKGYTLSKKYTVPTSLFPTEADVLATYRAADTEPAVNGIEGLITYDNVGVIRGAMAEEDISGNPFKISEDGKTYTFKIKSGVKWVDNTGAIKGEVTADDFVAGFQHALDAQGGLEYLADGVIAGVGEYLRGECTWDEVGYKVNASGELEITLVNKENYFPSRLVYALFMPMKRDFFLAKGGVFGLAEWAALIDDEDALKNYKYGQVGDPTSLLYNSAFYNTKWETTEGAQEMVYVKNPNYYDADKTTLDEIKFVYEDGSNVQQMFNNAVSGVYFGLGLNAATGSLKMAQDAGIFDTCAYISDTTATTFFGGFNLNRGSWEISGGAVKSNQTEAQKILNHKAFNNKNFRLGFLHGFDRASYRDVAVGEGVGKFSLRNMYTHPEFVRLGGSVTDGTKVWPADTTYGDLVQFYANAKGANVRSTADLSDGWYDLDRGLAELQAAKTELGSDWKDGEKIVIDYVYWAQNTANVASSQAFKRTIEGKLGDFITVNLIEAKTKAEYYYSGYLVDTGEALPQDFFDGSGWGPDYVDPGSYLDTFSALRDASMVKVIGLDPQ